MRLLASNIIDRDIEGHYAFFPFVEQISTRKHQHDFYEIFLIAEGSIYHHSNSNSSLLTSGSLVFIRPDDTHFFHKNADENCELINLAFPAHTFSELVAYLGTAPQTHLLEQQQPPTRTLTVSEKNAMIAQLREWSRWMYHDKSQSRVALRGLLAHMIANFFIAPPRDHMGSAPLWLRELCQQMQEREHIIEGRSALLRLANRTPEHIGRAFKTHLGVTPSQFINDLRLDYASDLLLHTDHSVIEICFDVGFGNLSHFYHLFKARWGYAPSQFRKMNARTLLP